MFLSALPRIAFWFLECSNWWMNGTTAADVARGTSRMLIQEGYSPLLEFTLANGRRLDVAALGTDGCTLGVEIKVSLADLKCDAKWKEYLEFCDFFFFAIPPEFPDEYVPTGTGLIVADRYGGAIVRPSPQWQLHPSRRKAVTLRFGKVAAERLAAVIELTADSRGATVFSK
jgi:hypothetical protein